MRLTSVASMGLLWDHHQPAWKPTPSVGGGNVKSLYNDVPTMGEGQTNT
ncbi:MAG: hypothetical protein QW688_07215 [Thermoprotei archaeon]